MSPYANPCIIMVGVLILVGSILMAIEAQQYEPVRAIITLVIGIIISILVGLIGLGIIHV